MKKHNGMRPLDVVVLLKIASKKEQPWKMKNLSFELGISASEISESLNRSSISGLIAQDKKTLMKGAFKDFLIYGLKYVFPTKPSALGLGIPTAMSASPLNNDIQSERMIVSPYSEGIERGEQIEPLHPNVPKACLSDQSFYELIALCDALRIGRIRERNLAVEYLNARI